MANLEGKKAIVEAFINKLGNVENWTHNGIVNDHGPDSRAKCVCGHAIRYGYEITDGVKTVEIGSECINNFAFYNVALFNALSASLAAKKEKDKEDTKKSKAIAQSAELAPIIAIYDNLYSKFCEAYNKSVTYTGYQPNQEWYYAVQYRHICADCKLKSFAGQKKWYAEKIKYFNYLGFTA